jgi:hypothetical protein
LLCMRLPVCVRGCPASALRCACAQCCHPPPWHGVAPDLDVLHKAHVDEEARGSRHVHFLRTEPTGRTARAAAHTARPRAGTHSRSGGLVCLFVCFWSRVCAVHAVIQVDQLGPMGRPMASRSTCFARNIMEWRSVNFVSEIFCSCNVTHALTPTHTHTRARAHTHVQTHSARMHAHAETHMQLVYS